jgi:hypothetical protein
MAFVTVEKSAATRAAGEEDGVEVMTSAMLGLSDTRVYAT